MIKGMEQLDEEQQWNNAFHAFKEGKEHNGVKSAWNMV